MGWRWQLTLIRTSNTRWYYLSKRQNFEVPNVGNLKKIKLQRGEWSYDPGKPVGAPGGFGAVFEGIGEDQSDLAIKKLNVDATQAAHRELKVADEFAGREFAHIVPILDSGIDAESDAYFVVMERADRSLQDYIEEMGHVSELEAAGILIDIAMGLSEVSDLVHRDLKPANVLFHKKSWKIADFGIARFIGESTSLNTLRDCLTPHYGAPEQWKLESCSQATDIYALACIAHFLFRGQPPFEGRSNEELRQQHLMKEPPVLGTESNLFESLVSTMLRKTPETRPSLKRVHSQIDKIISDDGAPSESGAKGELQVAAAQLARQQAQVDAQEKRRKEEERIRQEIATEGYKILNAIVERLFGAIEESGVNASVSASTRSPSLQAGPAVLTIEHFTAPGALPFGLFPLSKWDVIAGATIQLTQSHPPYSWGSSLWYLKQGDGAYRWTEVGYMGSPLIPSRGLAEPFPLRDYGLADKAAATMMTEYQFALGPTLIDDEDEIRFQDRWLELFATALSNRLQRPSALPVRI